MRFRFNLHTIAGVVLGLLGIVLALQNFGALSLGDVQLFWPLLIVAFGLCRVVERTGRVEGLTLLVVGAGIQLSNLGLFALPERDAVRYWPLAVVVVGLWELLSSLGTLSSVEGSAIAALGLWLQLSYFGTVHLASFRLWPLGLTAAGGLMLWRGFFSQPSG